MCVCIIDGHPLLHRTQCVCRPCDLLVRLLANSLQNWAEAYLRSHVTTERESEWERERERESALFTSWSLRLSVLVQHLQCNAVQLRAAGFWLLKNVPKYLLIIHLSRTYLLRVYNNNSDAVFTKYLRYNAAFYVS